MSYWVIIFISCSFNKHLNCKVEYIKEIYETSAECEDQNKMFLIPGQCVETPLSANFLDHLN
jgi:hypothetical protein